MAGEVSRRPLAIVNIFAYVIVIVVNALATSLPLGGLTTGQLSDLYPNLFVPAGLTFSIWGVIYLLLAIYVVYGLVFSLRGTRPESTFMEKIGVTFLVSCVANAAWIFAWQYRVVPLSLACMLILLLSLIIMYRRLDVGTSHASGVERFLVHLPVSIYLGWITVATIANITALLSSYGALRSGPTAEVWAVAMIAVGVVLGIGVMFLRRDLFYALVVDWAVLGIYLKRTATGVEPARAVVIASLIAVCLLSAGIVVQLARRRVYR